MTNKEFIQHYKEEDVRALALKRVPEGIDLPYCLRQIEGWQTARYKLPRWAATDGIIYPPRLSMEQCSSERTAMYKCETIQRLLPQDRSSMADLTGGFGIDFSYLAAKFGKSIYVERQEELCAIARHNISLLGLSETTVRCAESEDFLPDMEPCTLIFLDPARRDTAGRKVAALEDCSPDVTKLASILLEKADVVMLKLSPMLDIHDALRKLPCIREVHVISVEGECKELLLVMKAGRETEPVFHCANLGAEKCTYIVDDSTYQPTVSADIGEYLYEPNASILKAGVQDSLCKDFGLKKLHPFSHLFTSGQKVEDFPGRCFRVVCVSDFSKRSLKEMLSGIVKANLTIRNFPSTVAELRKKWRLKEGGDDYLFATTVADGSHALILCKKA